MNDLSFTGFNSGYIQGLLHAGRSNFEDMHTGASMLDSTPLGCMRTRVRSTPCAAVTGILLAEAEARLTA